MLFCCLISFVTLSNTRPPFKSIMLSFCFIILCLCWFSFMSSTSSFVLRCKMLDTICKFSIRLFVLSSRFKAAVARARAEVQPYNTDNNLEFSRGEFFDKETIPRHFISRSVHSVRKLWAFYLLGRPWDFSFSVHFATTVSFLLFSTYTLRRPWALFTLWRPWAFTFQYTLLRPWVFYFSVHFATTVSFLLHRLWGDREITFRVVVHRLLALVILL